MIINYTIVRSRRKTLMIYVMPDGSIEVRAPIRTSISEIERFVTKKQDRIRIIQEKYAAVPKELPPPQYSPGEFERAIKETVNIWEHRLGVSASFVGLRKMSSRWGSCTPKTRRIRLNTALEYCPRECLDYVIIHELAHMLEHNHSSRFWAIVSDAAPDYKEIVKQLNNLQWIINTL